MENYLTYLYPPPISAGGLNLLPNFQKGGGLDRTSVFRGDCWERGGDFFQGGFNFSTKNRLTSGMFHEKKVYKQERFALS